MNQKTYMGSIPGAVGAPSIISSGNSGEPNGELNCCLKEVAIVKILSAGHLDSLIFRNTARDISFPDSGYFSRENTCKVFPGLSRGWSWNMIGEKPRSRNHMFILLFLLFILSHKNLSHTFINPIITLLFIF